MTGMPIYLACDLSAGSEQYGPCLENLTYKYYQEPLIPSRFRIRLIGFSPGADVFASLNKSYAEALRFPLRTGVRTTGYGAMFKKIPGMIENDVREIKQQSGNCLRPLLVVVGISAPSASDVFLPSFQEMMATRAHPNVIAVSIGDSTVMVAKQIASIAAFKADRPEPVCELIVDIMNDAFRSRQASDVQTLRVPVNLPGLSHLSGTD